MAKGGGKEERNHKWKLENELTLVDIFINVLTGKLKIVINGWPFNR